MFVRCFFLLFSEKNDKVSICFCSMFPRSTHDTFSQKLYQTFKNHKRFGKPKLAQTDFTICHYAGDVSDPHNLKMLVLMSVTLVQ